jgi:hypothetical protein
VFTGDLGVDDGIPRSVYSLVTDDMTQVAGRGTDVPAVNLRPGEAVELPNGLGTVTFDDLSETSADGTSRSPLRLLRHPPRPVPGLGAHVRDPGVARAASPRSSFPGDASG